VNDQPKQLGFDIFAQPERPSEWPDPAEVRAEMLAILALARQALDTCPWDERTFRFHKQVFPQMANWLPEEEAAQLRTEFAREVARIEQLLAA